MFVEGVEGDEVEVVLLSGGVVALHLLGASTEQQGILILGIALEYHLNIFVGFMQLPHLEESLSAK